ncbi:STAS domain-containing protein [Pseudooceanicola sp.]|uniref:STAS domain-containing protein n=1 Tax=Pseudooceanicola sp. TaxID=1914328 RepID=UPI00261DEF54|nr:STAS domain-containing protein [Pseudooceanicola sp.]MDF1854081.1 STAS domain-containing protein [Pseudooceanicola sp.]
MAEALILQSQLNLSAADPLAQDLRARLGGDITLDARAVTHLGTLCLQVLIAAAHSCQQTGHRFNMVNAPDWMTSQLEMMGLSPETLGARPR